MDTKKIDKTIDAVCDWIQEEINKKNISLGRETVEMVNALASLVEARAEINAQNYTPLSDVSSGYVGRSQIKE